MEQFIDVSEHNGAVDFTKVTADAVFIRSSLGYGDHDKMLQTHAKRAADAGLALGYYHFAYPSKLNGNVVEDARSEANYFVDLINKMPKHKYLAVDLEDFDSKGKDTLLSKEEYGNWLETFLDIVEGRTQQKCIIYTYADYCNRHLPENHSFGVYPLWIANYGAKIKKPPLPKGWKNYFAWQYTQEGKMAGIAGHVDISRTT